MRSASQSLLRARTEMAEAWIPVPVRKASFPTTG